MSTTLTFEIPALPPEEWSLNSRAHGIVKWRAGKRYKNEIRYSLMERFGVGRIPQATGKMRLDLTVLLRDKRDRDEDNMRARFKPGQDQLVAEGMLVDDSTVHMETGDLVMIIDRERAPLTIVQLTEVPE